MPVLDEEALYRQQMTQQQVMMQPSMPPPVPASPSDDFFMFRVNGSDILEEIQHQLRGEVYTQEGRYEKKFTPWMNEDGINKVSYLLYSNGLNKNTLLGNLQKEEIYGKCLRLWIELNKLFFKEYQAYGISKEMRTILIQTIINSIHSGLSRSEGGKEADQLSTAHQRHDIYSHNEGNDTSWNPLKKFMSGKTR